MAITEVPRILMRREAGGTARLMFENPHEGAEVEPSMAAQPINRLRIYYTIHPSVAVAFVEDLELPFVLGDQPTYLTFEPASLGTYVFAWAHVNSAASPAVDIEGPRRAAIPVYGNTQIFQTLESAGQTCFSSDLTVLEQTRLVTDASRMFEEYTGGNWFHPRYHVLTVEGKDANEIQLPDPIMEVLEILIRSPGVGGAKLDPAYYLVYNRHMAFRNAYDATVDKDRPDGALVAPGDGSGGLTGADDDRRNPKISFVTANEYTRGHMHAGSGMAWREHGLVDPRAFQAMSVGGFRRGRQNYIVKGFFGFTDPDFAVPVGVRIAVERLAIRQAIAEFGGSSDLERSLKGHRVIMEKTDTHTIQYEAKDRKAGYFTGDPIVDDWIATYARNGGGGVV